jgi:long-chain acyl-CoA synthetase
MILDADVPKEDLASLVYFSTGAAPLDPRVQREFEARYGIPVLLSYGATEFGGPVCAMTPQLHQKHGAAKFGSVGQPFGGARIRVVDQETGAELPAGEEGLLEVISPKMGADWIHTSDLGVIDQDGFLFLRGRADGAIMRGGFKLLPETIQDALLGHPAVSAAAVVGVPDRRLGQVPAAAIQLKPGVPEPTELELEGHLRQHVLSTHIPVYWLIVAELPKTVSLKVDRPAVIRLFAQAGASDVLPVTKEPA